MRRFVLTVLSAALLIACGPGKKTKAPATAPAREFPLVEIPVMLTDPQERLLWIGTHMWDRFTDPSQLFHCDSSTVNGVGLDALEGQMGAFTTILHELPLEQGQGAVSACYNRLEAFQKAFPQSNMLPQVAALVAKYLYDPNSPVRSEDLYLPFVERLASSDIVDPDLQVGYRWDADKCALNRIGTIAANFTFIDTAGKTRTLHGIKAEKILLIFGNPDCHACKEITEYLESVPELESLISSGSLKVVDIYIDEDIELWKSKAASYPAKWINGYDPYYTIRGDLLYNIRAIPSVYLLDRDKRVVMKDVPIERIFQATDR